MADMSVLQNALMMNYMQDYADSLVPLGQMRSRIPTHELAAAMRKSPVFNQINLNNSQVGFVNTGTIERINAAITLTQGSDLDQIGKLLQTFGQQVAEASDLVETDKKAIFELMESLSQELLHARKASTIAALMTALLQRVADVAALAEAGNNLWEAIKILIGPAAG